MRLAMLALTIAMTGCATWDHYAESRMAANPCRNLFGSDDVTVGIFFITSVAAIPITGENAQTDKGLHRGLSFGISHGVTSVLGPLEGVGASLLVGGAKEYHDSRQPGNQWDWQDMRANAEGALVGSALTWGVCEATR